MKILTDLDLPTRIGPCEFSPLGAMIAVRCPHDFDHLMHQAGGQQEAGSRRWLIERRPMGPLVRNLHSCRGGRTRSTAPHHVGRRRIASAKRDSRMTRIVTYVHRFRRIALMFCLLLATQALPATAKVVGGDGVASPATRHRSPVPAGGETPTCERSCWPGEATCR
jgi:hypothetical protein